MTSDSLPYFKESVYSNRCSYIPDIDVERRPNVIIFFVESLSARFLTPYHSEFDSITPNINRFANASLRIVNYYNHTIPTLNGLVGQLCSVYPCFTNSDFEDKQLSFKMKSLIHILDDRGYKSSIYCYENKGFTLYNTMKYLGFTSRFFKQDIEAELNFVSKRNDYLSDNDIFRFYLSQLKTIDTTSPFIHVVSTIDTHAGYELPDDIKVYPYLKNNFLNAVYNFDAQWGLFWDWFQQSPLKDNTIVILTADHSLPYTVDNLSLYKSKAQSNPMFDEIPLIIYSPFHNFPQQLVIHSSSISLAPTILHMLNINCVNNNFVGHSIFDTTLSASILGIYSDQIFGKSQGGEYVDLREDSLISKWMRLNRYIFQKDRLYGE